MSDDAGLLDAIGIAMEAEEKARDFYNESRGKVSGVRGKDLLGQLADFEQNHYDKLKTLKDSLAGDGGFIQYGGTEFKGCGGQCSSEVEGVIESEKNELVSILNLAIEAETKAHERYLGMAQMTEDPKGKEMFHKLAHEEMLHRRILSDEFYHITNKGVWVWSE